MNSWQGRSGEGEGGEGAANKVWLFKAAGLILMGKVSGEMTRKRNGCHYKSAAILYQLFPVPVPCLGLKQTRPNQFYISV